MENKMFCFQCQETAGCKGCTICGVCGKKIDDGNKWYVGPTKLALSLLYMF